MEMKVCLVILAMTVAAVLSEDNEILKDFSVGYTQFAADVYKALLKSQSGNFLVCPLSVDLILGLAHDGARGRTARQLSGALHLPQDNASIQKIFHEVSEKLKSFDNYELRSANKIYVKDGFEISDQFRKTAVQVYDAEIQNIDFTQSHQAASEMNHWVEEKTHNKITDLISKDDLNEDTRAILINAMYFHGKWLSAFNENDTKKRTFHINANNQIELDMMEMTNYLFYEENSELNAKILTLLYDGEDVSLTIILPNDMEGLPDLEARIDEALVISQNNYEEDMVHVVIPKFKIESTIQFKPVLQTLGVIDAFENSANFSGIGAHEESLVITKVIQKAFIEVEEKGTTAAAATGVIFEERSFGPPPAPEEFVADHPFIFYLKSPAGVMFVGRFIQS